MADKRMSAEDVVARLESGMTIGIGGWGSRRKPMTLVRAILRSALQDLTIVSYGGPDVGMLCASGKVRRVVYGFVSLDNIPLEPNFQRIRQAGAFSAVRSALRALLPTKRLSEWTSNEASIHGKRLTPLKK